MKKKFKIYAKDEEFFFRRFQSSEQRELGKAHAERKNLLKSPAL